MRTATSPILGRTKAGTLRLVKDAHGLLVEIDPPQTTIGRDILESVKRGDVSGMSFGFAVVKPHGERFEQRDGIATRIISGMRIPEVSVVPGVCGDGRHGRAAKPAGRSRRHTPSRRHRIRVTVG